MGGDVIEGVIDGFLNGSIELQDCHYPKPVLLASGEVQTRLKPDTQKPDTFRFFPLIS